MNKPNISYMEPVTGFTANVNEWITFKAKVNDQCGVSDVSLEIQGYALTGYETKDTIDCPSGYFCKDYRFPTMGENWWHVEAIDSCGVKRITGDARFYIGSCPRHLRSPMKAASFDIDPSDIHPEN